MWDHLDWIRSIATCPWSFRSLTVGEAGGKLRRIKQLYGEMHMAGTKAFRWEWCDGTSHPRGRPLSPSQPSNNVLHREQWEFIFIVDLTGLGNRLDHTSGHVGEGICWEVEWRRKDQFCMWAAPSLSAAVSEWTKRRKPAEHLHPSHCFLIADTTSPATAWSCCYAFPAMMDWTCKALAQINPSSFKLFLITICHSKRKGNRSNN